MDEQTRVFINRRVLEITDDILREKLIEQSPQLQKDVVLMADMIREFVSLERQKRGLDSLNIELYPIENKRLLSDPDFIGETRFYNRIFQATARHSFDFEGRKILRFNAFPKS